MEKSKVTKKQMFEAIREVVKDNEDMVAFINHEVELLDNRAANKKPTKTQEANGDLKAVIVHTLTEGAKPMTVTEMMNAKAELSANAGISNQKLSALLRQLVLEGTVVKTTDGKKSVFSLA